MELISEYTNGNTNVKIFDNGTKIRQYEDVPEIEFPESLDVKITNYCDMGCLYCHESSTKQGLHSNLDELLEVLKDLPAGVELAIGGGNPLSHPELINFLQILKIRGIIANITVNQGHLKVYHDLLVFLLKDDLIKGLGISITNNNFKYIESLLNYTDNIVYHVIVGVNKIDILDELIKFKNPKVLVLGYKKYGFGINHYSESILNEIKRWYKGLRNYIGKCTLSFDNLGIEQLNVRRLFTDIGWEKFYMGDDFEYTMYIDAVERNFAPTSRSTDRISFDKTTLLNYFKNKGI